MSARTRILDLGMLTALSNETDRVILVVDEEGSADDAAEARDALGITGSTEQSAGVGLRNLQAEASFSDPISLLVIGDSFNIGYYAGLDRFHIRGAFKTAQVSGGGDSGVTPVTGAYDKSPDGTYYSIASGGNLTCGHLQYEQAGPADQVHYTLFPGTGTAQLEYNYSGAGWTPVGSAIDTTLITSVQCATVSLPFGYTDSVKCRVTATGGTVNGWIGQSMQGPGIVVASFATTGQSMAQTISVGETIWKAMLTAWGTNLIVSSWADGRFVDAAGDFDAVGDDNFADDGPFDRAHTWSKEALPDVDWIFIGPHQVKPDHPMVADADLDAAYEAVGISDLWDERAVYSIPFLRDFALSRGEAFVDTHSMFSSFDEAVEQGMYEYDPTPTVHLSAIGKTYKANLVYQRSGMDAIFGTKAAAGLAINGYIFNPNQNFGQGVGLSLYNYRGIHQPLFCGTVNVVDQSRPDGVGCSLSYITSGGSAQIGTWVGGSYFGHANFNSYGVHPVANGVGALGKVATRWAEVHTNLLNIAQATPASAAATGTANTICFDADYIYVCTATNTWKRAALSTW